MATRIATATTPLSIPTQPWETDAACAHTLSWARSTTDHQRAVCATCPVIDQCADLGRQVIDTLAGGGTVNACRDVVYGGQTLPELAGIRPRRRDWAAVCEQIEQMIGDGHDRHTIARGLGYGRTIDLGRILRRNGHHATATRLAAA